MPTPSLPDPDDDVHEWVSFDLDGDTYTFDVTWLTSSWSCIYGAGCPGIGPEPAPELEIGCCTWGAHFTDKADRKRIRRKAAELRPEEWQLRDVAEQLGGPILKNDDGAWVTRVVDDACIFLNRPDHPGGAGCAFHQAAVNRGESYLDWKPEVCWQVPMRLDYHRDDNDHLTYILREWKRRDWGEGGADFHWWCTEDDRAFVGHQPVYRSCAEDIVALVGRRAYIRMVELIEARPREVRLPHPALNRRHRTAD
jgi:hypothetical protein